MTQPSVTRNFDVELTDLTLDMPMSFQGKPMTAQRAILIACYNQAPGDEKNPDAAPDRFVLGNKVSKGGNIEFTPEELSSIRKRVRLYWPAAQISGQVEQIIDKKET